MTTDADYLLTTLLQLPADDRGELAARLLESLDSDADAESGWDEEIWSRVSDVSEGSVTTILWAEAREQIVADGDGGS